MSEMGFATIVKDHIKRIELVAPRYLDGQIMIPLPSERMRQAIQAEVVASIQMICQHNALVSDVMRGAEPSRVRIYPEHHRYDHFMAMAKLEDTV